MRIEFRARDCYEKGERKLSAVRDRRERERESELYLGLFALLAWREWMLAVQWACQDDSKRLKRRCYHSRWALATTATLLPRVMPLLQNRIIFQVPFRIKWNNFLFSICICCCYFCCWCWCCCWCSFICILTQEESPSWWCHCRQQLNFLRLQVATKQRFNAKQVHLHLQLGLSLFSYIQTRYYLNQLHSLFLPFFKT